jgi:soluble lytic murein transglycosylase
VLPRLWGREVSRVLRLVTFVNGRDVIGQLFPNATITSGYRGPGHPLSKKNPKSYHALSIGAVDIAPIPGMTFNEYLTSIRKAGYRIVEARDEVKNPSKYATGPHWHVVIGK